MYTIYLKVPRNAVQVSDLGSGDSLATIRIHSSPNFLRKYSNHSMTTASKKAIQHTIQWWKSHDYFASHSNCPAFTEFRQILGLLCIQVVEVTQRHKQPLPKLLRSEIFGDHVLQGQHHLKKRWIHLPGLLEIVWQKTSFWMAGREWSLGDKNDYNSMMLGTKESLPLAFWFTFLFWWK